MSENTKKPVEKKQVKSKVANTSAKKTPETTEKKKLSKNTIAILISVAVVLLIAISVGIFFLVDYIKNDKGFNYLKSDLSKYIQFNGDYKNLDISLDIAAPREVDVDCAILAILASNKESTPKNGSLEKNYDSAIIGAGDKVYVWYRGYIYDSNNEKYYIPEFTNFANANSGALEIGSGGFYPGVELSMVGMNTDDFPRFDKITDGRVRENMVLYVSYTRYVSNGTSTDVKKETEAAIRIDLTTDVDAVFGTGFKDKLMLSTVGGSKWDFKTTCGEKSYEYANVKVEFATECERNPLVISGYIPYDATQESYRNTDVHFEIYFDGMVDYDAPEFNDEFVQKKIDDGTLGITVESLDEYEGSSLSAKYRSYVKKVVFDVYEADYDAFLKEAIWTKLLSMCTIKKYPVQKLQDAYNAYIYDVNYKFAESGGRIYNDSGTYQTYSTIDEYAEAYYGTASYGVSWSDYCYIMAQSKIKERILLFYIMREENLLPSDADLNATYNATVEEYLNEYINETLNYDGIDKDDMTEAEYAEFVKKCRAELFNLFGEEEFKETSYYLLAIEDIKAWPGIKVTTLDTPAEDK